jgi:cyclase
MRIPSTRVAVAVPFLALFAAAAARVPWQQQQRDFSVQAQAVAGPVHALIGQGGNVGVSAGPDGVLVVDSQFPESAPEIRKAITSLAKTDAAPKFLVNTHHHGDHTGGNPSFGGDATVIAHDNVRKRLAGAKPATAPQALPEVTYAESCSIHFNGEEIRLLHYPASHTDGDTVVWFTGSNVVHLGDLFFHQRFPFIDTSSGGDPSGLESSVADLLSKLPADAKLIPGHGPLATIEDLRAYHAMLVDTQAIVRAAVEAGKDAKAIVAEGLLAKYEKLSWGFVSTAKFAETLAAAAKR